MAKNTLYYGDNLEVMRKHIKDNTIDLCYIDPPFNSKRNYNQIYNAVGKEDKAQAQAFIDTWTWDDDANKGFEQITTNYNGVFTKQSIELIIGFEKVLGKDSLLAYLVSMTLRIAEIFRVLKPTGSFYLHCDPTASHYLKLIIDAVFCAKGGDFQNEIIWRRTGTHGKSKRFAPIHDVILFYTKSEKYKWNYLKKPYMRGHVKANFVEDTKGWRTNYYGNVLTGSGLRNGESGKPWMGFDPSAKGRHWAIPGALIEDLGEDVEGLGQHEKLDRLYEMGFIKIVEGQAWPVYERYITPSDGQNIPDIWAYQPYTNGTLFGTEQGIDEDVRWLSPQDQERLGYQTQKPEALLERIIGASTNKGDLVLDAYCGCGTTVAVAEGLKRQWIGIDITYQSISLILKRMEDTFKSKKVLDNIVLNGIPEDFKSAEALAHKKDDKTRKEFEKWAVLTYSNNKAIINEKKGSDAGIDGIAYMADRNDKNVIEMKQVLFSVKSDKNPHVSYIRDFYGAIERDNAAMGYFITLYPPTKDMMNECKKIGKYKNQLVDTEYPKIEIVTVENILAGNRITIPTSHQIDVVKSAKKKTTEQEPLF